MERFIKYVEHIPGYKVVGIVTSELYLHKSIHNYTKLGFNTLVKTINANKFIIYIKI